MDIRVVVRWIFFMKCDDLLGINRHRDVLTSFCHSAIHALKVKKVNPLLHKSQF